MALATTCPQCKTSFKVVPDQLKLRRGLVRCGVCQHVFSGIDYLRYVDDLARTAQRLSRDRPAAPATSAPAPTAPAPASPSVPRTLTAAPPVAPATRIRPPTPAPTVSLNPPMDPWAAAGRAVQEGAGQGMGIPPAPPRGTAVPGIAQRPAERPALPAPDEAARAAAVEWEELLGRPKAPWPATGVGPQTVVASDAELKTAFFLPETTIGLQRSTASVPPTTPPESDTLSRAMTRLRPEARTEPGRAPQSASESSPPVPASMTADMPVEGSPEPTGIAAERPEQNTPPLPSWAGGSEPAVDYRNQRRRRRSRRGLEGSPAAWAAAVVLGLLLLTQAVIGWRNDLAARLPALAPVLSGLLTPLGASISPPRALDALTIEGFELQTAASSDRLQVSAMLRNRASYVVSYPAMELTLTDTTGQVLVRTVIPAEAYLSNARLLDTGLAAGAERPVRFALAHDGLQPTGYTVALFYP